jgi:hypothetical protein
MANREFYAEAVAVRGAKARIRYLQRGLGWAVREFGRALPRLADAETRSLVTRMRDSHRRSIREFQASVDSLPDWPGRSPPWRPAPARSRTRARRPTGA